MGGIGSGAGTAIAPDAGTGGAGAIAAETAAAAVGELGLAGGS